MNPVPYLPLIRRIARLYHTQFLEADDLVQEACLRLLQMEQTEHPETAESLHCIDSPQQKSLSSAGYPTTESLPPCIPSPESEGNKRTAPESLTPEDTHALELAIHRAMQAAIRRYENLSVVRMLPKDLVRAAEEAETKAMPANGGEACLADLEELMETAHISPRQRQVLSLHYGLDGRPPMSRKKTAEMLGRREKAVEMDIYRAVQRMKKMKHHNR